MALLSINLLEQQQTRLSRLQQTNVLVAVVIGTIVGLELLVGVFLISSRAIRSGELNRSKQEIADLQKQIDTLNKPSSSVYPNLTLSQQAVAFQAAVSAVGTLVDNHKYFTLYLSEIALNTPSTIIYTSFSSTSLNQITVIGNASTYTEVSKLATTFHNLSFAKNVSLQSAKQGKSGQFPVEFVINIELKSAKELNLLPKPNVNSGDAPINTPKSSSPPPTSKALPVQGASS